jgi:hypothetical protein
MELFLSMFSRAKIFICTTYVQFLKFLLSKSIPPTLTLPLEGGGEGGVIFFGRGSAALYYLRSISQIFIKQKASPPP